MGMRTGWEYNRYMKKNFLFTHGSLSHSIKMGLGAFMIFALSFTSPLQASAASATVREAQQIATHFGLPVGTVDGEFGPKTARGLCAFRYISGMTPSRATVSTALLTSMRSYKNQYASLSAIPAPTKSGSNTYVVVNMTCQTMFYVESGKYVRVMPVSTGMDGHRTPTGTYTLGNTNRGWSCSTIYPESCSRHTAGRFAYISNYGNMYNKRLFKSGGYYVHGSTSVPTYPASHGCIRVTVSDSDWLYDHVGNVTPPPLFVTGSY